MFFQQKKPRAGGQAKLFDEKVLAEAETPTGLSHQKYGSK
jgi:hypothetical protein